MDRKETDFALASQRIPYLSKGAHEKDSQACALEYLSIARGIEWTDNPTIVRCWDIRPLNDIPVSDKVRTKHLLPVLRAYDGSLDWPIERQLAVVTRIVILTVNRIISRWPELSAAVKSQCEQAEDLRTAESAWAAAWAAAGAAAGAVQTEVFQTACEIWLEAAKEA